MQHQCSWAAALPWECGLSETIFRNIYCILQTTMENKESGLVVSAINCYFMCQVRIDADSQLSLTLVSCLSIPLHVLPLQMFMFVLELNQNGMLQHILANYVTIHFSARRANTRTPILISYPVLEAEGAIRWWVDLYLAVFTPLSQYLLSYSCAVHHMSGPGKEFVCVLLNHLRLVSFLSAGWLYVQGSIGVLAIHVCSSQGESTIPQFFCKLHVASQKAWSSKVNSEPVNNVVLAYPSTIFVTPSVHKVQKGLLSIQISIDVAYCTLPHT